MKSISSLLTAVLLCCLYYDATAQVVTKGSHHLYLGYVPASSIRTTSLGSFLGPVVAGYRFALGKRITLGAELGYAYGNTGTHSFYYQYMSGPVIKLTDKTRYSVYCASARFDYHYVNRKRLDIYSGVMVDVLDGYYKYEVYTGNNSSYTSATGGLCIAGCRYMVHPNVGVYGEFTYREMGYGVLGVSVKLGKVVGNEALKK